MSDQSVIFDLLKEIRDNQQKQGEVLSDHSKELAYQSSSLDHINEDMKIVLNDVKDNTLNIADQARIIEDLKFHYKELKNEIEKNAQRILSLEEPEKFRDFVKKKYLHWASMTIAITSVITLVTKLMHLW